ncbi:hypothetical protein F5050DRAFT_1813570 [Lentinula boryana]|uniref:Zn(2)-C6 fungal-type domain-containing protein n=1 Tax=Lentinula boryana TaxID=40481 RepID=A0ABQ8PWL5_9AGAR|nr:hypothetical protein F5050DRAFT_1813570 [Lentinula boryana]
MRAREEEEAAAEARLVENHRKREEKKKREAEEKKKKEEEEKKKKEEEERVAREKKEKEDQDREARESKTREEENRAKTVGALVRDSIARKEQAKEKGKENRSLCDDSILYVGKKRKRTTMMSTPIGDPDDSDNDFEPEGDDNDDDDDEEPSPTPSPQKSSKCDRCTSKEVPCILIGEGSASCQACRKAKVKCSLVGNDRTFRRSKRLKREESKKEDTPVASSSSRRIDALEESNRELSRRLLLMEDMVRFIVQTIRPVDANEESEEDRVKRTGDVKGKGRKD